MSLKANDLRKADFSRKMRGFDVDEVQAFLTVAADRLEQLETNLEAKDRRFEELETELERYRTMDQGLRDTLLEVRSSSEGALENARREAELILREASLNADKLLDDGRKKQHHLDDELVQLKRQREGFISRFRHLLESQRELLEVLAAEDALPYVSPTPQKD